MPMHASGGGHAADLAGLAAEQARDANEADDEGMNDLTATAAPILLPLPQGSGTRTLKAARVPKLTPSSNVGVRMQCSNEYGDQVF